MVLFADDDTHAAEQAVERAAQDTARNIKAGKVAPSTEEDLRDALHKSARDRAVTRAIRRPA